MTFRVEKTISERFWGFVDKGTEGECWNWRGARTRGYGQIHYNGKTVSAHRLSLILDGGEDRPGLDACHTCDNPPCVNPKHLYFGTRKRNHEDAVRRDRVAWGERNPNSKLDEDSVRDIRRRHLSGESFTSIAQDFPVAPKTVASAARGSTWRRLNHSNETDRNISHA